MIVKTENMEEPRPGQGPGQGAKRRRSVSRTTEWSMGRSISIGNKGSSSSMFDEGNSSSSSSSFINRTRQLWMDLLLSNNLNSTNNKAQTQLFNLLSYGIITDATPAARTNNCILLSCTGGLGGGGGGGGGGGQHGRASSSTAEGAGGGVSIDLLLQTLSKQASSFTNSRKNNSYTPSPPSSSMNKSNTLAGNSTKIISDPGDILLEGSTDHFLDRKAINSHGCFIHASEDEFRGVRLAAVDAMCQIGLNSREFAKKAYLFLIDMFNDEDETVRLNSVQAVAILGQTWRISITDEVIPSVILAVCDREAAVQTYAHRMLRGLAFESVEAFSRIITILISQATVNSTTTTINTPSVSSSSAEGNDSPNSLKNIMESIAIVSRNHPSFAASIIPKVLQLQKPYLPKEFSKHSISHIAHMVMIFNACDVAPVILSDIPAYVLDRETYVRYMYPTAMPPEKNSSIQGFPSTSSSGEEMDSEYFLKKLMQEFSRKCKSGSLGSKLLLRNYIRELKRYEKYPCISLCIEFLERSLVSDDTTLDQGDIEALSRKYYGLPKSLGRQLAQSKNNLNLAAEIPLKLLMSDPNPSKHHRKELILASFNNKRKINHI